MALQDTLLYLKKLEAVGFSRKQAEAQVELVSEGIRNSVATRNDLLELRSDSRLEFADFRKESALLRAEMRSEFADVRAEMSAEFANVRAEMGAEFASVRAEMKNLAVELRGEMAHLQDRITIRLGGMMIVGFGALAALIKLT